VTEQRQRPAPRVLPSVVLRAVGVVALVPVLLAISFVPLVWPDTDEPSPADAVVILSGDHGERLPIAMSLVEKGLVRTVVFVGTIDRAEEDVLCRTPQRVEYVCLRPEPDNTREEARAAARLAQSRRWREIVVVTSKFHVVRSSVAFRRCFDGNVRMMGGDPPYDRRELARQTAKEWLKVVHTVVLSRTC
jgi:uncharacterized SAM-binding protein YcdF (DUF218 family)